LQKALEAMLVDYSAARILDHRFDAVRKALHIKKNQVRAHTDTHTHIHNRAAVSTCTADPDALGSVLTGETCFAVLNLSGSSSLI
jgi:hypothetical protein